jgi:hypothetical protein
VLTFNLLPFDVTHPQAPHIRGSLSRYGATLSLNLSLRDSRFFDLPEQNQVKKRAHGLWQRTCFEIFIKAPNDPEYIEINLSPSGSWNAYFFKDTRLSGADDGLMEINPLTPPQISGGPGYEEGLYKLNALIELPAHLPFLQVVGARLALAAVIMGQDQHLHYCALKHPDDKPDFHHPNNFTLRI